MLDDRKKDPNTGQFMNIMLVTLIITTGALFFFRPDSSEDAPDTYSSPSVSTSGMDANPLLPAAGLPEIAEAVDAQESDQVILKNEWTELHFTKVGARLKYLLVWLGEEKHTGIELIPRWDNTPDVNAVYPLGLRFADNFLEDSLDQRRWEAEVDASGKSVTFTLDITDFAQIRKTFTMGNSPYTLDVKVDYVNLDDKLIVLGNDTGEPAFSLNWGPNVSSGDKKKGGGQRIVWRKDADNTFSYTRKLKTPAKGEYSKSETDADWIGIRSAYFMIAMKPEFEKNLVWASGKETFFWMGVGAPRAEVASGATHSQEFTMYMGPMEKKMLAEAWPDLDTSYAFFTTVTPMDKFAKFLLGMMTWFHNSVYANWGVAIIFVTIIVRTLMLPLTLKSMKSMKGMQQLAPEMEKIKAECGDDQAEVQKRMMELYKERGLNPLGGCFPLLLQMPIFIAFYRMIWSAYELRGAPFFFWITDLSHPDQLFELPFHIPLPVLEHLTHFNLLPILMGAAMVVSQKLMPTSGPAQNPQQKMMMTFMPVIFSVICYNMAAGTNLYILTSTVLGIVQNYFIHAKKTDEDETLPAKKPKKKKKAPNRAQHFYTAAQARKREAAKEARRQKKQRKAPAKDSKGKR